MLKSCTTGGLRCSRRVLVILLAWCLLIAAMVQFSHSNQANVVFKWMTANEQAHQQQQFALEAPAQPQVQSLVISRLFLRRQALTRQNSTTPGTIAPVSVLDLEPLLDKRPAKSEDELMQEIVERLSSFPLDYWTTNRKLSQPTKGNEPKNSGECQPKYPSIFELEFNNVYWQTLHSRNGTFQLFGAFYDDRKLINIGPVIRIVGMINVIEPTVTTYCQMWYEGEKNPKIVGILEYKYIWHSNWGNYKQGIYQPYVIACKVPQSHWRRGPPASVSFVEKRCDTATNNLRVIYNKPAVKKDFAVCVKGLDFLHEDLSVRLVEWIELITLLGADKIFFYELQVHPNVSKVLKHFQQLGKVHVTPLTLPGGQPNLPALQHMYLAKEINRKRQNELIPYNDCLYKHMYEYEYIALLDVDEVIMPTQDATWQELMARVIPKALKLRNETRASYNVRNVYFLDDFLHSHGFFKGIPKYMHMLQHVYRSKNFTEPNHYIKCFHNPERVVALHNHFPVACLGAGCTSYPIDTQDAQLQHYRTDCVKSLKKTCLEYRKNRLLDTTIWRYKDQLIARVTETLKTLGFFGHNS